MDRRGMEGHMDWEYQNQPAVDPSSPFARLSKQTPLASFDSPARFSKVSNDPFASAVRRGSPLKPEDQSHTRPPHAAFFQPQLNHKPTAPAFRNPAFTTPQKHFDDSLMSDYSPADSSPSMTDTSIMPAETPDQDREEGAYGRFSRTPSPIKMASPIKSSSPTKSLFGQTLLRNHAAGRGEIAKSARDKVRKRRRQQSDRDVGSVRPRLQHESDGSDSDYQEGSNQVAIIPKNTKAPRCRGWVHGFLSTITAHPTAPALLSKWLSFGINLVCFGLLLIIILAIYNQVKSDLNHAADKARDELRSVITICKDNWVSNGCFPKNRRMPALEAACNEWEVCMNQDPDAVSRTNISISKVAEILNEFVNVLNIKTWAFLMSILLVMMLSTFISPSSRMEPGPSHPLPPAPPVQSPPAGPPMFAAGMNPSTAYIWAPINQTPRSVRKTLFIDDATDVDSSPDYKAIMPPPQTPSGRRSPSKGDRDRDRNRSPSKGSRQRSPSKGY